MGAGDARALSSQIMKHFSIKLINYLFALLAIHIVSCQAVSVNPINCDNTGKPWSNTYPNPFSSRDELLQASYNVKWIKHSGEDSFLLEKKAYLILCEWGMKMDIDPSVDLYRGEYKYHNIPFLYSIYVSDNDLFLIINVFPNTMDKIEELKDGGMSVSTASAHPIEIRLKKSDFTVLSILSGS